MTSNAKLLLAGALLAASLPGWAQTATGLSALQVLEATDKTRGGGLPGVSWDLKITAIDPDSGENVRMLHVKAEGDNSVAETYYPARAAGGRLLQLGRNMWYGRPDLQKPVSISSRQKMMGPAANGDIAATNYMKEYDGTLMPEQTIDGEPVYVLNLVGKTKWVTYDRIVYYVSRARLVPVKAEFYTVSGKLFKTAIFETGNIITHDGRKQPFVSRMVIHDAIGANNVSVLEYSAVKVQPIPRDELSLAALTR
ncbi:outer membrane lipoprotein-sorting protein [Massilia horti]|nr:outer membrane lipoprotein-sorting protein [Massilia horti]